jgi:[ribosomal protein S18]-alanine N-acetyltransferase
MARIILPHAFPFADSALPCVAQWMRLSDIERVMPIEQASFPAPWPASAYRYELTQNDLSYYLVVREQGPEEKERGAIGPRLSHPAQSTRILGYGGFWLILDEAHISTIAVHPDWRGRGLGEMVLVALVEAAILCGAGEITLEVRVSNAVAQNLYLKYGFVQVGIRKRYYQDNNEDALIMTTPRVDDAAFRSRYDECKRTLRERLEDKRFAI